MASGSATSPLLHPAVVYLFETITVACILGFTTPSSPVRLAALPLLVACVAIVIPTALDRTGRIFWASYFTGSGITCLLQYIETALLSHWSFETRSSSLVPRDLSAKATTNGGTNGKEGNTTSRGIVGDRLRFGYRAVFSYRNIGAPDEVKNVPRFSTKDPQYVPSRRRFLLHKLLIILVCYTILDLATSAPQQADVNAINFSARKVPFFRRLGTVSGEDLIVRVATTLGLWVSLYCVIQAGTNFYAFLCVGLGIDERKDWPPSFGSLKEAYSVRRFWG